MVPVPQAPRLDFTVLALGTKVDGQHAGRWAGLVGMQPPLSLMSWQETSPAASVLRLGGACAGAWLSVIT